jgi:DNA-binding SARP family transcriptional activator/TolB-like protein
VLRLKTFGGLSLQRDSSPVEGAGAQRRRLALLALLAAAGERGLSREKILGLLWPESDLERGRKSLAQAVYALRKEFGAEEVITGTTELRLGWDGFTTDLADFRQAFSRGEYEAAASLYAGPFLDGVYLDEAPEFDRWAETERRVLAHDYAEALERLARAADKAGDLRGAVAWWRKLANADPLNGKVALGLMRALSAQGDRGAALQFYRVYEMLLRQELDIAPESELKRYAEQIRRETPMPVDPPSRASAEPPSSPQAEPPSRRAAEPPSRASAEPPSRRAAEPPSHRAAEPLDVPPSTLPRTRAVARPVSGNTPAGGVPSRGAGISGYTDEYARPRPIGERPVPPEFQQPRRQSAPAAALAALVRKPFFQRKSTRYGILIGFAISAILFFAVLQVIGRAARRQTAAIARPIIAVGLIRDYTGKEGFARPLAEMLATNLARAEGLQVISTARMYELAAQQQAVGDSSGRLMTAARAAGASELLEGSLFDSSGTLRLELRRTDIATGNLRPGLRVHGRDLFTLVDAGTTELVRSIGVKAPIGGLAEVTTTSLLAYRLYEEGLRALFAAEEASGQRLLRGALQEDSTFAMAAYWLARSSGDVEMMRHARDLSAHTSEKERLLIQAGWADIIDDPTRTAMAESLVAKYPGEPEGWLYLGHSLRWMGDFTGSIAPLKRVLAMDSLSITGTGSRGKAVRCLACEAIYELIGVYHMIDSLQVSERIARDWIRRQPQSAEAWGQLSLVLGYQERYEEALAAHQSVVALAPRYGNFGRTMIELRAGRFAVADSMIRDYRTQNLNDALKWESISLRMQGRLREALPPVRQLRANQPRPARADAVPYGGIFEAYGWSEVGDYRRSAAMFDSITRGPLVPTVTAQIARNYVWTQTLRATALAAGGDTTLLAQIADSLAHYGPLSGYGRDRRLHHHVRGLLLEARGDLTGAIAEYRKAIFSPPLGYTRTNLLLGRLLLKLNQPREAAWWAEQALSGSFESTNTYVTQTEFAELAALAWDAAGERDKALARYRIVVANWAHADPQFSPRVERARLRITSLSGR